MSQVMFSVPPLSPIHYGQFSHTVAIVANKFQLQPCDGYGFYDPIQTWFEPLLLAVTREQVLNSRLKTTYNDGLDFLTKFL